MSDHDTLELLPSPELTSDAASEQRCSVKRTPRTLASLVRCCLDAIIHEVREKRIAFRLDALQVFELDEHGSTLPGDCLSDFIQERIKRFKNEAETRRRALNDVLSFAPDPDRVRESFEQREAGYVEEFWEEINEALQDAQSGTEAVDTLLGVDSASHEQPPT